MQTLELPEFVYCNDCGEVTGWFYNQNDLCCSKAHHIIATFHEKPKS